MLAARYECRDCGRGFALRIESPHAAAHRLAQLTLAVFLATVPLVLAFIHLGLWLSNRRAIENLYLALCLASFAGIVAFAAASELSPWGDIYYVGLVAFAIGTSLFIVNSFDATRRKLERNEGEIASARKLQEAMLPKELPSVAGLDIAAYLSTATDVGGDYYDFRESPDGALVVAIGDAAGHGLAAGAMVTAMKALFASVRGDEPLAGILERCDGVLRRMDLRLLHMCLALVRFRGRTIEICSAAMPPALIRRATTGAVEELGAGGLPLGGRLRGTWESRFAELAPGDTVLLASDGLGELLDPHGTPIGFEEIAAAFARSSGSPSETIAHLNREAARWQGRAEQADDITIVVVGVR